MVVVNGIERKVPKPLSNHSLASQCDVRGSIPNCRAASLRLRPSICTA